MRQQIQTKYLKGKETTANYERQIDDWEMRKKSALTKILGHQTYNRLTLKIKNELNTFAPGYLDGKADLERRILRENFGL